MADSNDRVTQAILNQTLENNTSVLKETIVTLKEIDKCVRVLESRVSVAETRLDSQREDINAISRKADGWNLINSVGASVAAIVAWFK